MGTKGGQGIQTASSSDVADDASRDLQRFLTGLERLQFGNQVAEAPFEGSRLERLQRGFIEDELQLTGTFAPQFQELQQAIQERGIQNDPFARDLRNLSQQGIRQQTLLNRELTNIAQSGLQGVARGDLPDDVQARLLESARAGGAARGILGSEAGIVAEAANLAGGAERFRQSRIAQAQSILGGVAQTSQPGLGLLNVPGQRQFRSLAPTSFESLGGLFGAFSRPSLTEEQLKTQEKIGATNAASNVISSIIG